MAAYGEIKMPVKLVVVRTPAELHMAATGIYREQLINNPISTLGFATGQSVIDLYGEMVKLAAQRRLNMSELKATFINNEYIGLKKEFAAMSLGNVMRERFFGPLGVPETSMHFLNWQTHDPQLECWKYEKEITDAGGIDLQILGIGVNGHISYNEPGIPFDSTTHVVNLDERTRIANSRHFMTDADCAKLGITKGEDPFEQIGYWNGVNRIYFDREVMSRVPKHAITMGIGTIMRSRKLVLLAQKVNKASALRLAIMGDPERQMPVSFLRFHPDVTIVADEGAASKLPKKWSKQGRYILE